MHNHGKSPKLYYLEKQYHIANGILNTHPGQILGGLENIAAKKASLLNVNNLPDKMTGKMRSQAENQCIAREFLVIYLP